MNFLVFFVRTLLSVKVGIACDCRTGTSKNYLHCIPQSISHALTNFVLLSERCISSHLIRHTPCGQCHKAVWEVRHQDVTPAGSRYSNFQPSECQFAASNRSLVNALSPDTGDFAARDIFFDQRWFYTSVKTQLIFTEMFLMATLSDKHHKPTDFSAEMHFRLMIGTSAALSQPREEAVQMPFVIDTTVRSTTAAKSCQPVCPRPSTCAYRFWRGILQTRPEAHSWPDQ